MKDGPGITYPASRYRKNVRRNEQEKQDPQALMHGADKHFKNNLREAESDLIKR